MDTERLMHLNEVTDIELGGEGVRITFWDGRREFVEGEAGYELYRRFKEARDGERR
jgi:hypothetical protein